MSFLSKIRARIEPKREGAFDHEKFLSQLFNRTPEELHTAFSDASVVDQVDISHTYARVEYLGKHGLHAFIWAQNMEPAAYARFFNIVRSDSDDKDFRHFERGGLTSFVSTENEFLARNVYLLTNDVSLLKRLARLHFSPNPPWIMYPDLGPFAAYNQGDAECWHQSVWIPFWKSLNAEERDEYIHIRSVDALTYMSAQEMQDWISATRKNDPEFRERE
jgi:hypothetical protein